MAKKTQQ